MFLAGAGLFVAFLQGQAPSPVRLVPGVTWTDRLPPAPVVYTLRLSPGVVAVGHIRGIGCDVSIQVQTPDGEPAGQFFAGASPGPFDVVATTAGDYRLKVSSVGGQPGSIEVRWDPLSAAEYADRRDRWDYGAGTQLYALARQIRRQGEAAVDAFFQTRRGKGPLIEPYPPDPGQRYVTFLFRGDSQTEQVNTWAFMLGTAPLDLTAAGWMPMPLQRLAGSSLWVLRTILPSDTLMGYNFEVVRAPAVDGPDGHRLVIREATQTVNDPLMAASPSGYSILRLEDAPEQPWIVRHSDIPHGHLESYGVSSGALGETRRVTLYLPPPGLPTTGGKGVLVVLDGEAYDSDHALVPTPVVLDNLIAQRIIPPTVAVFVRNQGNRDRDLANSLPFARFLAEELLPWLQHNYGVSRRPADTVIAGSSLGGFCAAYCAFHYPNRFGAALCQSPAMYPAPGPLDATTSFQKIRNGYDLTRELRDAARKPIRFYIDSGLFEGSVLEGDRQLRDVLELKGYAVTYVEHSGSHDYAYWRNSIGNGLRVLLGRRSRHPIVRGRHRR